MSGLLKWRRILAPHLRCEVWWNKNVRIGPAGAGGVSGHFGILLRGGDAVRGPERASERTKRPLYNEHLNFHIGTSESISWSELSEEGVFSIWKSITKSSALYRYHFYVWIYALWNICSSKLCVKWAELRRKTTMQYFINYNFCRTTAAVLAVHKFWLWRKHIVVLISNSIHCAKSVAHFK